MNCRLCRVVMVPEAIPPERLARYGAKPGKLRRYPGLKEEYYLADFEPDEAVLGRARARPRARRSWSCGRRPRCRSTTASRTRSSGAVLERLAGEDAQTVVLPRTREQREEVAAAGPVRGARARGRRAEPRGVRRSRDLGRRDDEPRGRRARHARLHDLRGPAGRGGRGAAARGPPAPAHRSERGDASSGARGQAGCGSAETRANSSHFSSRQQSNEIADRHP